MNEGRAARRELERAHARLRQKLAHPGGSVVPGDPRLRVVLVVMIVLLAVVFAWGFYDGRHFNVADVATGRRWDQANHRA